MSGNILTRIVTRPIHSDEWRPNASGLSGAVVEFLGVVRSIEYGEPIEGLEYEAFVPMAEKLLAELVAKIADTHQLEHAICVHRIGYVPVAEPSLFVFTASPHRKQAYAASMEIIDELKRTVPIWKHKVS